LWFLLPAIAGIANVMAIIMAAITLLNFFITLSPILLIVINPWLTPAP
jgi:hypothetical protein